MRIDAFLEPVFRDRLEDAILEVNLRLTVAERRLSVQQLVDNYPKSPNIGLLTIAVVYKPLGGHV